MLNKFAQLFGDDIATEISVVGIFGSTNVGNEQYFGMIFD